MVDQKRSVVIALVGQGNAIGVREPNTDTLTQLGRTIQPASRPVEIRHTEGHTADGDNLPRWGHLERVGHPSP